MMIRSLKAISLILLVFCFISCCSHKQAETGSDNAITIVKDLVFTDKDENIVVEKGAKFTIKLLATPTAGYQWIISEPYDTTVVVFKNKEHVSNNKNPNMVGGNGYDYWYFVADKKGATNLVFKYARPWEKDKVAETDLKTFKITVK